MIAFRLWVWLWGAWICGSLIGFYGPTVRVQLYWVIGLCLLIGLIVRPAYWQLPIRLVLIVTMCAACAFTSWSIAHNHSQYHVEENTMQPFSGQVASVPVLDGDEVSFRLRDQQDEWLHIVVKRENITQETKNLLSIQRGTSVSGKGLWKIPAESGNVGLFDYRSYLKTQHVFWVIRVEVKDLKIASKKTQSLLGVGDRIRTTLSDRFFSQYADRYAGLLSGMLLGDRVRITEEDVKTFSNIGLGHMLAISGLHVTVLVASWLWLMTQLRVPRILKYGMTYLLLVLFVIVTGASIPVVRAALTGAIGLWFAYRRRLRDAQSLVAATGILMLLWDPYYLLSVSYQLSFAVTFGLVALGPAVFEMLPSRWPIWVRGTLSVSILAQGVAFPFQIMYFNELSLLSLPINLVFVPVLTYLITPLGYASLAIPLAWLVEPLLTFTVSIFEKWNSVLWARTIWASPSWWWVVGYVILLGFICFPFQRGWVRRAAFGLFVLFIAYAYLPPISERQVYMEVLDVGQGDAILLHMPNRKYWLMDGGGAVTFSAETKSWKQKKSPFDPGADIVVPLLMKRGVKRIDTLVMSHANEDHLNGLQAVVERIPVGRILFNGSINGSLKIKKLYLTCIERGIPFHQVQTGERFALGRNGEVQVLNPQNKNVPFQTHAQNELSVVLYVKIFQARLLLTGDLDESGDAAVLHAAKAEGLLGYPLSVLKVSHHGSRYASTPAFLAMWQPQFAAISVGAHNRYGHPTAEVLERLRHVGARVHRTDRHGAIRYRITRQGVFVYTKKKGTF